MSLSKSSKKKLEKIGSNPTKLAGFYQYANKTEAICIINLFEQYLNNDGTFKKCKIDAHCDPIYQQLSAAIDYYKFDIKRKKFYFKNRKVKSKK